MIACVASIEEEGIQLCDQSRGGETIRLRWDAAKVLPALEVGDLLAIRGARVAPAPAEAGGRQRLDLVVGLDGGAVKNLSEEDRRLPPDRMFGGEPFRA